MCGSSLVVWGTVVWWRVACLQWAFSAVGCPTVFMGNIDCRLKAQNASGNGWLNNRTVMVPVEDLVWESHRAQVSRSEQHRMFSAAPPAAFRLRGEIGGSHNRYIWDERSRDAA